MRHDTDDVASKLVDEILAIAKDIEAFVVISSIDVKMAKGTRKYQRHYSQGQRSQLNRRLNELSQLPQKLCNAIKRGGLTAARAAAEEAQTEPQSIWWCASKAECEFALAGIYKRLQLSNRPYDAYELGTCGPLGVILIWRD